MELTLENILSVVWSSEAMTFNDLCDALGNDCPEKGDREAWRDLFRQLESAKAVGLITLEKRDGRIESIQLTKRGADKIRERADSRRGLFRNLKAEEEL